MSTTQRYIAFLRAINVGGHTVKMERLRALFEDIGLQEVETFIASGNVIFAAPATRDEKLEATIEAQLKQALGYAVATFVRSSAEIAAIVDYEPFPKADLEADDTTLYVGFLPAAPSDAARQKLEALSTDAEWFHIHGRELYWLTRRLLSQSNFSGALLEKTLGLPMTMRNITTVRRLAKKYPPTN